MKQLTVILLATLLSSSCKKDEPKTPPPQPPAVVQTIVSLKFDGTLFSTDAPTATRKISTSGVEVADILTPTLDNKSVKIQIQGGDANTKKLVVGTKSTGIVTINLAESRWVLSNAYNATFTVTGVDEKHIEGTFTGAAYINSGSVLLPEKQVTEGKFLVTF